MSSSQHRKNPIWYKLIIPGKDGSGTVGKIKETSTIDDIADLKKKIKEEEELIFPASRLLVFPPGTEFDQDGKPLQTAYDPDENVGTMTTSATRRDGKEGPLVVVVENHASDSILSNKLVEKRENCLWYLVSGIIERNQVSSGCRHALFKIASGGYYPMNLKPEGAFAVKLHPFDATKRLLSVSVVFADLHAAEAFVVKVDSYVTSTHGVAYFQKTRFTTEPVEPYTNHKLVLESDYIPNQADDEAPHNSPVWDVEVSDMDISALSPTTIFSRSDTVYKYQRIETDQAFARSDPEGAHIFPKSKCKGEYEWLDKPSFNRLALSRDGHKNFDGSANGQGVRAETGVLVALEPTMSEKIMLNHETFTRISNRLWCRSEAVAKSWRPYLKKELRMVKERGHVFFEPIYMYCESKKTVALKFEAQQESDGALHDVCLTCIPGVDDHTTLETWDSQARTVAVSEIMMCLLRWRYYAACRIWKEIP